MKVYTEGNYFFMELASGRLVEEHKSSVLIDAETPAGTHVFIRGVRSWTDTTRIDVTTLTDQGGTPYTAQTFRDFYTANTGFNPASGGSGAGLPTVNSNTITFADSNGVYFGSYSSPRTGSLTLSLTGAVTGGFAIVYYQNPTLDVDSTLLYAQGSLDPANVNKVYIEHDAEGNLTMTIINPIIPASWSPVTFTTQSPQITESPAEIYASSSTSFNAMGQSDAFSGDWEYRVLVENSSIDKDLMIGATNNATFGQWNSVDWDFGVWVEADGHLRPIVAGVAGTDLDTPTTLVWASGDYLIMRHVGANMEVYLNETLIHTFSGATLLDYYMYITPTDEASGQRVRYPQIKML